MNEERMRAVKKFLEDKEYEAARDALDTILSEDSQNVTALLDLNATLGHLGLLDEALQVGQSALDLEPDNPEVHFRMSWIYYEMRESDKAQDHASTAVSLAPDVGKYHLELAVISNALGDLEMALEHMELGYRLDPSVFDKKAYVKLWVWRVVVEFIQLRWILAVGMAATYIFLYELGLSGFGYKLLLISLPFVGAGGYYLIQHRYRRALGAFLLGVLWCGAVYAGVRLFFM